MIMTKGKRAELRQKLKTAPMPIQYAADFINALDSIDELETALEAEKAMLCGICREYGTACKCA